jgi:hypothetical protein
MLEKIKKRSIFNFYLNMFNFMIDKSIYIILCLHLNMFK